MAQYVVFKAKTFEKENELYFFDELGPALDFHYEKEQEGLHDWGIAEAIPMASWLGKLLRFLHMRSK